MPTRADVDLARAAIDRGFLTVNESVECLKIQRDHENDGRQVPLGRIFVEAQYLTEAQVNTLKDSIARANALRRIGHYEILSKLGAGGMGTVYKAQDTKADRVVALKALSPGHASRRDYIQRFLREAHASGQLSHPNIVQGYDAGEADGRYYFAMEFVDGITVGDMLKDGRPIPEQQALDIAIQVAKALQHAEEHHIVHRDIKPDNVMITAQGVAKLADLGLARLATTDAAAKDGRAFGTPYYASPEQCEGVEELDTKTDMYSFGAMLFHMLAGHVPFDDESPEGIMAMHLQEKRPYLKDLNVQLSHGVSKVVRKLMAKNKRGRYAFMSDVVKDLTLVRMGRSPRLGERSRYDSGEYRYRSSTGSWRTKPPGRRRKMVQISACLGVGAAILLGAYLLYRFLQPAPPATKSPDEGRRTEVPGADKKAGAAKTNVAERTAEIYLADVLKQEASLSELEFYDKLLSVGTKCPGTDAAKQATKKAQNFLQQTIEPAAQTKFDELKADAAKLRDGQRYQDALDKLATFPNDYHMTSVPEKLKELRREIRDDADRDLRAIKTEAGRLTAKKPFDPKNYDEAIALYRPALRTFGIAELRKQADQAVRRLRQEKARLVAEARRKAAEQKRKEMEARDRQRAGQAAATIGELVRDARFQQAADEVKTLQGQLEIEANQTAVAPAAADLAALHSLVQSLKDKTTGVRAFVGETVTLADKAGKPFEGTVLGVHPDRLVIQSGGRVLPPLRWHRLSPRSLRALAELKKKKSVPPAERRLAPAERLALAALFHFSGQADDAEAELKTVEKDPAQKAAAASRRRCFALLAQKR